MDRDTVRSSSKDRGNKSRECERDRDKQKEEGGDKREKWQKQ